MLISIIIPVYNEVQTIQAILQKVRAVPLEKEIIVVDGNSTDGTRDYLKEEEKYPDTRVVYKPQRCGRGLALKIGMELAKGDIFIFQDADLELDPADYPTLLKPFEDPAVKVVFGSRFLKKDFIAANVWQESGNKLITQTVNILFHARLTDAETGYQVFRREVYEKVKVRADEFNFTIEFTCKILKNGYTINEVPISFYPRSKEAGKKLKFKDGVESLYTLLKYWIIN